MAKVEKLIGTESALEVGQKINEIIEKGVGGGMHKPFDVVMKDHVLTFEESEGLVAFGDYAYKTGSAGTRYGYPEFYDKCVQEYSEAEDVKLYTTSNFETIDTSTDGSSLIFKENFNAGNCNASVHNFSTTRYIASENGMTGLSFGEYFSVNLTTGSDVTTEQTIASFGANYNGFLLRLEGGKLHFWASTNGTSWNISEKTGTSTLVANTEYTIMVMREGQEYNVKLIQQDGTTTTEISVVNVDNLIINGVQLALGISIESSTLPFLGTIHLLKNNESVTYITNRWYPYNSTTFRKHSNNHIYYNATNNYRIETVENIYKKTGMAWFYGVDTTNERVRMPRNDHYFMCGTDTGVMVNAGLPDHIHPLTAAVNGGTYVDYDDGNGSKVGNKNITTKQASLLNPIYGDSDTVQTDAVKLMGYICVGNTETEVASTEVVEVTTTENDTIPLFSGMYFDFKPNNISWLAKDTVQSKSGKFYETTYNELVKCLNDVDNKYNIKVIDVADMVEGVDYSLYWKVDQVNMTFTTPSAITEQLEAQLYFKVGNAVANKEIIDVGTLTETVNNKIDINSGYVDGQPHVKIVELLNSTGTHNQTILDLSQYLPNDEYDYNVKFKLNGYDNDSTYAYYLDTDLWVTSETAIQSQEIASPHNMICGGEYSRQNFTIIDLPVGSERCVKITGAGADNICLFALGYRRMGKNK